MLVTFLRSAENRECLSCKLCSSYDREIYNSTENIIMVKVALWVQLEAKPGKEQEVADFLNSALPLVEREPATVTWFALRMGPTTFGIFDAFENEGSRQSHLTGAVAAALMSKAPDLLAKPPQITKTDVLAAKVP